MAHAPSTTNGSRVGARRAARRDRSRQHRAWWLLLLACGAVLAWPATEGVRLTRSLAAGTWNEEAARDEALFDCLDRRVGQLVPPGGTVYVDTGPAAGVGEYLQVAVQQRLTESVTARPARAVTRADDAAITVVVAIPTDSGSLPSGAADTAGAPSGGADTTGERCGGLDLTAVGR